MKYFLASLIIPIGLILFIVVFGIGALYFGVAKLLERMSRLMGKHSIDGNWSDTANHFLSSNEQLRKFDIGESYRE